MQLRLLAIGFIQICVKSHFDIIIETDCNILQKNLSVKVCFIPCGRVVILLVQKHLFSLFEIL